MDKLLPGIVFVFLLLFGCAQLKQIVKNDSCTIDSDCVPATCCHANACVNKIHAPDCTSGACTMYCEPGSIDCGGGCSCTNGNCTAYGPYLMGGFYGK